MQGYDKVIKVGLSNVITTFKYEMSKPHLPDYIFTLTAYYTSYAEFIGGFMLIIGFMKYYALYALGLDLILVAIAMGMINPLWNMEFVFPRLVLLLILLLLPESWDKFSFDHLLIPKH